MPSSAAYTGLARSRSETGCSSVLAPWVEASLMVAPPFAVVVSMGQDASRAPPTGASRFLIDVGDRPGRARCPARADLISGHRRGADHDRRHAEAEGGVDVVEERLPAPGGRHAGVDGQAQPAGG